MYCRNCGQQLHNERFCPRCGMQVMMRPPGAERNRYERPMPSPGPYAGGPGTYVRPARRSPYLIVGLIAAAVILLAAGAIAVKVFVFTDNDYQAPVRAYVESWENLDGRAMLDTLPPGCFGRVGKSQMQEIYDGVQGVMDEEYRGVDIRIDYQFQDEEELDQSEIAELEEETDHAYSIKEAKRLYVLTDTYYNGEEEDEPEITEFIVIKVGGKWYNDPASLDLPYL